MVSLYSGTPGSGKSLHSARQIILAAKRGHPVIANFPVKLDYRWEKANYTYVPNDLLTPKYLIDYAQSFFEDKPVKESSILLIIDECQLLFNAREWQKRGRDGWLSFFTQHRHLGYDIILIAQMDRMIDRQIRGLIEYEYIHRKLKNFGVKGFFVSLLTGGAGFCCVKRWYPLSEKLEVEYVRANKKVYSIYDTFALLDAKSAMEIQVLKPPAPPPKVSRLEWFLLGFDKLVTRCFPRFSRWAEKAAHDIAHPAPKGKYLNPGGRSELGWK